MTVKTYNPASVTIVVAGIPIEGFADGTFINVARRNPSWNLAIGSDGEGARARSNDNSGTITLTLMQSSASNDLLQQLFNLDENTGDGVGPFLLVDGSGRTLIDAESCWISTQAEAPFGREIENREWTIETDSLNFNLGGN